MHNMPAKPLVNGIESPMSSSMLALPSSIDDEEAFARVRDLVGAQVSELSDKVAALATRYEADLAKQKRQPELAEAPRDEDGLLVFVEFEALACTLDTEAALLGDSRGTADERKARFAALDGVTFELAMERLEAAGATLAPGFCDFAEQCLVRKVTLHILSRGWKRIIQHFLRSAGLGHVQVSANELMERDGKWRICFRNNTDDGHDKAEAVRRVMRDQRPARPRVAIIGHASCDLGPVEAEGPLVHAVYAPADSALAAACTRGGNPVNSFGAWEATARELLPSP